MSELHRLSSSAKRVSAILAERQRQDEKWGANRNLPPEKWVTILAEEVGEVARAAQEHLMAAMRAEAVQVAAVALAIVEWVDAWVDAYEHERRKDPEKGGSEMCPVGVNHVQGNYETQVVIEMSSTMARHLASLPPADAEALGEELKKLAKEAQQ